MATNELYERAEPDLSGVERDLYEAVSADEPWRLVERFAELERVSGSADERRAAEYLESRLDVLGVTYERYDPDLYVSAPRDASLSILAPESETFEAVKTVAFSASGTVEGPLAAASGPDGEDGDDFDTLLSADLSGLDDVAGAVVLLDGVLPIDAIRELDVRGAAAVVVAHPHEREPHDGIATSIWGGAPEPGEEDLLPDLPILTVARPVDERLRELAAAGEVTVRASATTDTGWRACPVIEARIAGEAAPDDDDFVLLHGHYDSWHVGVTDNATGDAGLLECVRVFHDHREHLSRNLRVCWWPGHSTGRYAGSTWYAEEFALDLAERCVAHVNMDSPGVADATAFGPRTSWMAEATDLCRDAIAAVAGKDADAGRPPRAGDYSFDNLGVTGLFMGSSNIPDDVREARGYHPVGGSGGHADAWHLTTDTLDKADPDVLVRDVEVYVATVARLLREDVLALDYRETVRRHRDAVAEYDAAAGDAFDLGPVLAELADLADALEDFYGAVESGNVRPARANETIKRLSRRLVRFGFCSEGQFEQDPATPRPPCPLLEPAADLPSLDDDARRFKVVALRRARNHVVGELRRARETIAAASD